MRKAFIGFALLASFVLASSNEAEAGRRNRPQRARMFQRSSGDNFFSRIMEVERRKNAWLRSTFLGN